MVRKSGFSVSNIGLMISPSAENSRLVKLAVSLLICITSGLALLAEEPALPVHLFAIPEPALRNLDPEPARGAPPAVQKEENAPAPLLQSAHDDNGDIVVELKRKWGFSEEARAQIYEGLNGPILTSIEPEPEQAGAVGWIAVNLWDPIFTLESISIRKVHVTGSIITAIQRKNPLCLLNPLVLAVDW
jgi:hypothetical protein